MQLTDKQAEALDLCIKKYRNHEKGFVLAGYAGTGKAQPNSTKIPTPKGMRKLGELEVGDYVFDEKGEPTKILGVYPQGELDVYKITLKDGRTVYCNDEHIFRVIDENSYIKDMTLREIMNNKGRYYLPTLNCKPVEYEEKRYNFFFELGVPQIYKYSSVEQRFKILKELFKKDSSFIDQGIYNLKFTAFAFLLLKDVQEILYSLGYNYTQIIGHNLLISIPNKEKYKFFDNFPKGKDKIEYDRVEIVDIQALNEKTEMTCIYVEGQEHLYLTQDYVITHNTTLVSSIVEALKNIKPGLKVQYAAYTGKASQVLERKGNKNAKTLHKLLFKSEMKKDGSFLRKPLEDIGCDILIIDECSMIPVDMVAVINHHQCFTIWCGDPFQIPPLDPTYTNKLLEHPDAFLTEIMRQAEESDIIQVSMKIREGAQLKELYGKDIMVLPKSKFKRSMLTWSDVTITATNHMRYYVNTETRRLLKLPPDRVVNGDKVTCIKNVWDIISNKHMPLINGTIGYLDDIEEGLVWTPSYIGVKNNNIPIIKANFKSDFGDDFGILKMDRQFLYTEIPRLSSSQEYTMKRNPMTRSLIPLPFYYAYGITGHRAQGSAWDKVLVLEESFPQDRIEHRRWLYTAITRCTEKCVLIKK